MAMKRCPVCGERYSDTYKTCPFCEEDELWEEEESQSPLKNHRSSRGNQHSFITPTLIVLIILMAALLVYLLYGDKVSQLFGKESDSTPGNDIVEPQQPSPGGLPTPPAGDGDEDPDLSDTPGGTEPDGGSGNQGASGNAGVMPEEPDNSQNSSGGQTSSGGGSDYATLAKLPGGLTLSNPDFTRSVSEGAYRLRVSGGSGTYTWVSQNPAVATVSSDGTVTPVSAGTVNILVTDGSKKAIGVVRVKGGSSTVSNPGTSSPGTSEPSSSGSGGSNTLSREDMTLSVGESWRLRLSGVTTSLTWAVADSSIATVTGDGTVIGVSKGQTTVTVSWDGQSRSCIVRVK